MRAILTGDWQAEWSNLDLCMKAAKEVEHLAYRNVAHGIFLLGDLKRNYNPVDMRVVKFWLRTIECWRKNWYVAVLLGNHDREGQYEDAQNWLEVLAKAGADVFDKPKVIELAGDHVYMLPYSSSVPRLKKILQKWEDSPICKGKTFARTTNDILLFHQDVCGAKYNQLGRASDAKLTVDNFPWNRVWGCFGGHIHLHQKVRDRELWYVGSPFATDWGEANQPKGYVVIQDRKFRFSQSSIPRFYDESWPGFRPPDNPEGARIRVSVTCDSSKRYQHRIAMARQEAERKYPGAIIFVRADFHDSRANSGKQIRTTDPDSVKIRRYVLETLPEGLKAKKKSIIRYLTRKLQAVTGGQRCISGVRFRKAWGQNILSFKKVRCDFRKQGLVVVDGRNLDRPGSSNGAGKTSYLQLIPIALFGTTFKGQKYDRWARRGTKHRAEVSVVFQDAKGRMVRVTRSRRPGQLRLWIDHEEQSSGLRSDARDATQGHIESVSGYTWQTLANAVYIDQSVAQAFLSGRKAERSAVLARFQNLERFGQALAAVKKDRDANNEAASAVQESVAEMEGRLGEQRSSLLKLQTQYTSLLRTQHAKVRDTKLVLKAAELHYKEIVVRIGNKVRLLEVKLSKAEVIERSAYKTSTNLGTRLSELKRYLESLDELDAVCSKCHQRISKKHVELLKSEAQRFIVSTTANLKRAKSELAVRIKEREDIFQHILQLKEKVSESYAKFQRAKSSYGEAWEAWNKSRKASKSVKLIDQTREEIRQTKRRLQLLAAAVVEHEAMNCFYEYCVEAFSRDGIPAFLNRQLVPVLNREAEYYAELLCDKAIQVRFEVENGEFECKTINATGGESTDDQSTGEQALAGLISAFALRVCAPRGNVLVLDEPGAGLDGASTRKLAAGLRELSKSVETVFVTSHNPVLLGELGKERTITVTKRKGISSASD